MAHRKKRVLCNLKDIHGGALNSSKWFKHMWMHGVFAYMMEDWFKVAFKCYGLDQKFTVVCRLSFSPYYQGQQLARF